MVVIRPLVKEGSGICQTSQHLNSDTALDQADAIELHADLADVEVVKAESFSFQPIS